MHKKRKISLFMSMLFTAWESCNCNITIGQVPTSVLHISDATVSERHSHCGYPRKGFLLKSRQQALPIVSVPAFQFNPQTKLPVCLTLNENDKQ